MRVGRDGHGIYDTPLPALALPLLPRGKGETRSLGTREFEGVKADGTMTTHTIPAGEIGNEKPIVVTSERWFSPELHVVVYAKYSDPRNGDTIYRLANLKRGEPPAELFRVPPEYKVRRRGSTPTHRGLTQGRHTAGSDPDAAGVRLLPGESGPTLPAAPGLHWPGAARP